jgi:hypothetical protein
MLRRYLRFHQKVPAQISRGAVTTPLDGYPLRDGLRAAFGAEG